MKRSGTSVNYSIRHIKVASRRYASYETPPSVPARQLTVAAFIMLTAARFPERLNRVELVPTCIRHMIQGSLTLDMHA